MEKESTEYILTDKAQETRAVMLEIQNKPLATQKFLHFTGALNYGYYAQIVSRKEDRISLVDRHYSFRFGNNGLFIQSDRVSGVTYHYKGRASQRLRIWSGNQYRGRRAGDMDLVTRLGAIVDPLGKHLFDSFVIRQIATKGMLGYIMAGNIVTFEEAMQYYIRYSLRGVGIKQDRAEALYDYLDKIEHSYLALAALRVAVNPNSVLDQFHPIIFLENTTLIKRIGNSQNLVKMAQATGEKIDWVDPHFNAETEANRLSRKEKRIKEFLQLWEGGPVLKAKVHSVNPIEMVDVSDESPACLGEEKYERINNK